MLSTSTWETRSIRDDVMQEYYNAIAASTSEGQSGPFIDFMLNEILKALQQNIKEEVPNKIPNKVPYTRVDAWGPRSVTEHAFGRFLWDAQIFTFLL